MDFETHVKTTLLSIISDMSSHASDFSSCPGKYFTRNRKLDFSSLIHLMLSMEAGTVRSELLKYFSFSPDTVSNAAFFQQRSKLSDNTLPFLFHMFNSCFSYKLYRNKYQLLAVDGSSFTFTRNPDDKESYFCPNNKSSNGYNQIHLVPAFDILSKRFTDCIVQPIRLKNEFQAMANLIDRHIPQKDSIPIFIADRGFHSLNVFAHAIENNAFFLIRATDRKFDNLLLSDRPNEDTFDVQIQRILARTKSKKKHLCPDEERLYKYICSDVAFDYIISGETPEYTINLRALRFKISDDGYENIITNLPPEAFDTDEIKRLYNLRWGIEISFREIKHDLGAMNFHSKNRKFIEMELWARLILYNFCSIIIGHVIVNKSGRKHTYQVNFSVAYKACRYFLGLHNKEHPPNLKSLIEKNILPIRHDRKYERHHRFRIPVSFTYRF